MHYEAFYKSIFRRKSSRKLEQEALASDKLLLIEEYTENIQPLFADIPTKVMFLTREQIRPRFAVEAPHYAAFYAPVGKKGLLSAGYQLQQLDLCLSAAGLGSCYLGSAKPNKDLMIHDGLHHLLMLAFGKPVGSCHREPSEFDRKPLEAISEPNMPEALLEPVRLAPSAINEQPWYFSKNGRNIQVWRARPFSLKSLLTGDLGFADMGIALCHLRAAAEYEGFGCYFNFDAKPSPVKGYEPICSALLN